MLFRGKLTPEGEFNVTADCRPVTLMKLDDGQQVSIGGFDWPGPSKGSLRLSLALLAASLPPLIAYAHMDDFDAQVVRTWDGNQWACTSEGIQAWCIEQKEKAINGQTHDAMQKHLRTLNADAPPNDDK